MGSGHSRPKYYEDPRASDPKKEELPTTSTIIRAVKRSTAKRTKLPELHRVRRRDSSGCHHRAADAPAGPLNLSVTTKNHHDNKNMCGNTITRHQKPWRGPNPHVKIFQGFQTEKHPHILAPNPLKTRENRSNIQNMTTCVHTLNRSARAEGQSDAYEVEEQQERRMMGFWDVTGREKLLKELQR